MLEKILQNQPAKPELFIGRNLFDQLVKVCLDPLPHKAFGLVGGTDIYHPKSIYPCTTNLRNDPGWKELFESYGEFYRDPDLGFVISPPEVKTVMDKIARQQESFIGVFHSHRYLHAEPSEIDIALSSDSSVLCYIISVARPAAPEVGIFRLNGGGYERIPIVRY
jgi:proteasome lid subunit RPN8/RPN11